MKANTNIERIIAKIDNDFNPNNTDWIPRVGAWTIDALNIIGCLPKETKKVILPVKERIVIAPADIFKNNFKVTTINGNKILKAIKVDKSNISSPTGERVQTDTTGTTDFINNDVVEDVVIANQINTKDYPHRYNVEHYNKYTDLDCVYYKISNNQIELNIDIDKVIVEYSAIVTYQSEVYNCELPVIPNNGTLIEAIAYYCLYKMLCRGYKHPVFNLQASQYGTNPYFIWTQLKDKARVSIINENIDKAMNDNDIDRLFRSSFFINTFDPRNT